MLFINSLIEFKARMGAIIEIILQIIRVYLLEIITTTTAAVIPLTISSNYNQQSFQHYYLLGQLHLKFLRL